MLSQKEVNEIIDELCKYTPSEVSIKYEDIFDKLKLMNIFTKFTDKETEIRKDEQQLVEKRLREAYPFLFSKNNNQLTSVIQGVMR